MIILKRDDERLFYLITKIETFTDKETIKIHFNEATHALQSLKCAVTAEEILQGSEEYEDTLLFFNTESSDIKRLFLLHITSIEDS